MSKKKVDKEFFLEGMGRLIKMYELHFKEVGSAETLPEGYMSTSEDGGCEDGVPSLGQMVAILNEHGHETVFNKQWTSQSLKLLLEKLRARGVETNIGHKSCRNSRANSKRAFKADENARKVYEIYLSGIDIKAFNNSDLSRYLNKQGSKTIRGNDWSPAGCGKLVKRLESMGIIERN